MTLVENTPSYLAVNCCRFFVRLTSETVKKYFSEKRQINAARLRDSLENVALKWHGKTKVHDFLNRLNALGFSHGKTRFQIIG